MAPERASVSIDPELLERIDATRDGGGSRSEWVAEAIELRLLIEEWAGDNVDRSFFT